MKRIYRYIAGKFWGPFFFALGVFAALVVLGDSFEKLKNLSNGHTTLGDILNYSLSTFPNWITTIAPVACLLAAISVISEMVSNGEWTAAVASGFAPRQLFRPLIGCIILVALATMAVQEFVVPPLNRRAETIYYTKIKPNDFFNLDAEWFVSIKLSPNQMLHAKRVDLSKGEMENVSVDTYDSIWNISNQVIAEKLVWNPWVNAWVFKNGTNRVFLNQNNIKDFQFEEQISPLTTEPKDLSVTRVDSKLLSVRDLTKRVRFFKQSGLSTHTVETARQSRFATPFVTLIMCLLGIPFAISLRRKSKIVNILASMVIAFTFWWLISMITSLGENGYLNPFIAGWGPVVFFSVVLFFEFKWMRL